jgi:hypothetical protein
MTQRAVADRLMDLCIQNAEQIAEQWYKSLVANPRTPKFVSSPKESCVRHATFLYKNLRRMYFADSPFEEVARVMDATGYAEEQYARHIPLPEATYALVLMRRHVWLYAESSAILNTALDIYSTLQSINRILLLFDYAIYIIAEKYEKMSKK